MAEIGVAGLGSTGSSSVRRQGLFFFEFEHGLGSWCDEASFFLSILGPWASVLVIGDGQQLCTGTILDCSSQRKRERYTDWAVRCNGGDGELGGWQGRRRHGERGTGRCWAISA
ncbi:hypothetical protein M0R45_026189 [Rubus argutus]|uniref:Uncharacterized protein n=1 Tax=Rubus argutus TaxID=59490 RepID=A0AAW1WW93_RUBAR